MSYKVVETKVGFAVQNTKTHAIVIVYQTKQEAVKVCMNLNKKE
jgi:hypothetical protein